ncbi:MAG TPA: response regulator transcription factor [Chitinophagaceae bacterium]|nr:response regulator transcription factor [Chitinophagaceae bacterium]
MKVYYIICEDNNDYRDSLVDFLDEDAELICCGAFANTDKVLDAIISCEPDVVLMDIDMPGKNGIESLKEIKESFPKVQVMMLTVFEDRENIFEAICSGATGYLLKNSSPELISKSIKEVVQGGAPMAPVIARKILQLFQKPEKSNASFQLTLHEQQVLKLLVDGLSYKMIAAKLNIVIDTVRFHIKRIYYKLHVHSAPEAVAKAIRENLL